MVIICRPSKTFLKFWKITISMILSQILIEICCQMLHLALKRLLSYVVSTNQYHYFNRPYEIFAKNYCEVFMKLLKSFISILLALTIVFTMMPLVSASEVEEETERTVYYSDLFFGYEYYLKNASVFTDYHENTDNILTKIYTDFVESDTYDRSFWKEAINTATSFKDLAKSVSDAFGFTNFTYDEMLESANKKFVEQMLNTGSADDALEATNEITKVLKNLHEVLNKIDNGYDPDAMNDSEFFTKVIDYLKEAKLLNFVNNTELTKVVQKVHEGINTGATFVNVGASIIDFAKSFSVAISMENMRIDLVSDIRDAAPNNSVLKDGMNKLYTQLNSEFSTYFSSNYLVPEVLGEIFDKVVSGITEKVLGDATGVLGLTLGVIKILNMVVFDVILDTPDIDSLTTQAVLNVYARDLYSGLRAFDFSDLSTAHSQAVKFEKIFGAYKAVVNAAIDNCALITLSGNKTLLERLKTVYYNADIFTATINQAKETIKNTPEEELVITQYEQSVDYPYTIKETNGYFLQGTDEPLSNCPYTGICIFFPEKGIDASLKIDAGQFIVPEGHKVYLDGYIRLYDDDRFSSAAVLKVLGEFKCNTLSLYTASSGVNGYYGARVDNYGTVIITNNISIDGADANFYQDENAVVYLSGSIYLSRKDNFYLNNGTIVFNGTSMQNVKAITAPKIVLDCYGVNFNGDVNVTELFDHTNCYFKLWGSNNAFPDYDGDGILDNEDKFPKVFNDCRITFTCNNESYCGYLPDEIITAKGDVIYISTYANEGARFVKWVNSKGETVNIGSWGEIEVTGSETYTAIFNELIVGDLDGDGKIDAVDIAWLVEQLLYYRYYAPWEAMELTGDYMVDLKDLVRLKKYIAGMDVTFGGSSAA